VAKDQKARIQGWTEWTSCPVLAKSLYSTSGPFHIRCSQCYI
jgi:hypothetical protein